MVGKPRSESKCALAARRLTWRYRARHGTVSPTGRGDTGEEDRHDRWGRWGNGDRWDRRSIASSGRNGARSLTGRHEKAPCPRTRTTRSSEPQPQEVRSRSPRRLTVVAGCALLIGKRDPRLDSDECGRTTAGGSRRPMTARGSAATRQAAVSILADSARGWRITSCSHHGLWFVGTCAECQRSQQRRWRRQLEDAERIARNRR